MIMGAIIGAIVAIIFLIYNNSVKQTRLKTVMASLNHTVEYSALYHYASASRFKTSFKFYDSFGALYLIGDTIYYKTSATEEPLRFNLKECTVQDEGNWKGMQWFSISTHIGEKFYFTSFKMGGFKNDSSETAKGLAAIQSKKSS